MKDARALRTLLHTLDGRGYKAYKGIRGSWRMGRWPLHVDHVQGDPFAVPSRVRVVLDPEVAGFPPAAFANASRALGVAAFLARAFAAEARRATARNRGMGTGRSGEIRMEPPGQEVVAQAAVQLHSDGSVEARFTVGLPARGRTILGRAAARLLLEDVPRVVEATLLAASHPAEEIERHAATNEDADALREHLDAVGLVAFVADGARLPRRSGVDDRPLEGTVVPFRSPDSLRVEVALPNAGTISGMGVPRGVTLIVGGGFHGKSTLLDALKHGVYNHRPGDGREQVVTDPAAVKIRAEDGRAVAGVNISPFIDGLPLGADTHAFSTPNASGSTSQAAAIVEALEAGARVLLVDEDTSATNFMIRDRRMQELVPKAGEPITPFVDQIRNLYEGLGVSSVLVLGGSGDYLDVADTVISMAEYVPMDVTERAREVARRFPTGRHPESSIPPSRPRSRVLTPGSLDPRKGRRDIHVQVPDRRTLIFGRETIDLAAVEQFASTAQVRAVGRALAWAGKKMLDEPYSMEKILEQTMSAVERHGLDVLDDRCVGDLAAFRRFEFAAALNRVRSLRTTP
ncbi:MAG: ABC-ATPase domain-containing protein [Gemmatimonadota bacterium]